MQKQKENAEMIRINDSKCECCVWMLSKSFSLIQYADDDVNWFVILLKLMKKAAGWRMQLIRFEGVGELIREIVLSIYTIFWMGLIKTFLFYYGFAINWSNMTEN